MIVLTKNKGKKKEGKARIYPTILQIIHLKKCLKEAAGDPLAAWVDYWSNNIVGYTTFIRNCFAFRGQLD